MANEQSALVRESIFGWLEHLAGDVAHTPKAEASMRRYDLGLADVLSVLETSSAGLISKEEDFDALFTITGATIDDEALQVTFSLDANGKGLCIIDVARL